MLHTRVSMPDARFHRWRVGFVNLRKVIVHVVWRNRVSQILDFLGESIREPREPAHRHPHREVLALHATGGNKARVRVASYYLRTNADDL